MQTPTVLRIVTVVLAVVLVTGCSKHAQTARLLRDADTYFKAGNYDKAKVSYLNVLRLDPQNAIAFERIGGMWQDDAAPLRAAPFLKKASELDPNNVENRIRLARCYLAVGAFKEAKTEVLGVLQQMPGNGDAITVLAESAHSKEDIEAAAQQIEKFPNRNDVSFHLASASLFLSKGDSMPATISVRQALSLLENTLGRDPEYVDGRRLQSEVLMEKGETKKAVELLEQLDKTYAGVPLIKYQLARAYLKNNNASQAKRVLEQAVSSNPGY